MRQRADHRAGRKYKQPRHQAELPGIFISQRNEKRRADKNHHSVNTDGKRQHTDIRAESPR
ncbi:hypothetical protein BVAD3_35960 [Bacillus velezensis]|nr:hypothetical protein BVAD3_35960 [Bacillus velezensis]